MDDTPKQGVYSRAGITADFLRRDLPPQLHHPKVAVVCGSGLGGLADEIEAIPRVDVPYSDIPGFPVSTVPGHEGRLVFGLMSQKKIPVMFLVGRSHFYEGHTMQNVSYAARVCKLLGVQTMIVSNAAGALNPLYQVGDIIVINDHINVAGLVGINPLRGPNEEEFGIRFPPLSDAYDLVLRRAVHHEWAKLVHLSPPQTLHEGIYAFCAGPSYETRAECRMMKLLGADLVGMSTVPEILVARHCGIRVLALSIVTNKCALEPPIPGNEPLLQTMTEEGLEELISQGRANHEEVLTAAKSAAQILQHLVRNVIQEMHDPSE